jgi:hypothetical protein
MDLRILSLKVICTAALPTLLHILHSDINYPPFPNQTIASPEYTRHAVSRSQSILARGLHSTRFVHSRLSSDIQSSFCIRHRLD